MPRITAVEISGLSIEDVDIYHLEVLAALNMFFSPASPNYSQIFFGLTTKDVQERLRARIEETEIRSAFALLTVLERSFRADYEYRSVAKLKGAVSEACRALFRKYGRRVSFSDQILEIWSRERSDSKQVIGDLRAAFHYRDWVAHGRNGKPRSRKYDYLQVYLLAETVLSLLLPQSRQTI